MSGRGASSDWSCWVLILCVNVVLKRGAAMNEPDKNAAKNITATKKPRLALRTRRVGAKMLMQMISGALLCAVAVAAARAQEEFDVNYKLGGVTSVRYTMYFELMFGKPETDCKIDPAEWYAAMDRVASQSTKLRFVSRNAEWKRMKKEENEGKCHLDLNHHNDDLPSCFRPQEPMPGLDFFVTTAKVENTCLAEVAAKLSDDVVGQTKFKATGRDNSMTRAEMWSSTYWVKDSEPKITASIIGLSQDMIKNLVYEWTRANCSDCDIIGDGWRATKMGG
jgi:hypothetical protein